jgi:hypothetical protein
MPASQVAARIMDARKKRWKVLAVALGETFHLVANPSSTGRFFSCRKKQSVHHLSDDRYFLPSDRSVIQPLSQKKLQLFS